MPIMCMYRALNVTREAYDQIRETVGWEANPPPGAISHAIGFDEDSAVEIDLWESRKDYEAYRDSRLAPVLAQYGVVIGEPEILDLHATAVGPPAEAYRLPRAITPAPRVQPA